MIVKVCLYRESCQAGTNSVYPGIVDRWERFLCGLFTTPANPMVYTNEKNLAIRLARFLIFL